MMHKAVLTCKLEAYRFERQMKPFHYFPSCFGNSMSDFWWSHSLLHWRRSVVLADTSLLPMLVYLPLQLPGRVEGQWVETWHMVTLAPGCAQAVQISAHDSDSHRGSFTVLIILMPLRHPYCQAFPYCPNVSGKVEGMGLWQCQLSCSEFTLQWLLCPVPSLNQMTSESRRTTMVYHQGRSPLTAALGVPCIPQGASRTFLYLK